jgi:hypothetical protein
MSKRREQRKHGTTHRSPRPKGTAKALRISRQTAKAWRAGEWGGWGRISVDGPGQKNPDRSEGPWGRAARPLERWCTTESPPPTQSGEQRWEDGVHEGRRQTAGAQLSREGLA